MKKNILILVVVVLAALLGLAACINNPTTDNGENVKSIEIVSESVPTQVKVGETPDFSGIKVKVVFEDNTTKEVGYSDVTVSAVDTSSAGEKTVTVTYKGVSVDFKVNVVEEDGTPVVTSIKIVPGSINLDYYIGQDPDFTTLQVEATYSNGTTSALKADEYTFTAIDTSAAGEKTFMVTYTANTELTDSVQITVAPISSITVIGGSVKNKLNVGETLDTSKIQVAVEYENGKGEVVEAYNLSVGTVDTTTYGKKSLSVTYKGITIEYPVEVVGMVSLTVNKGSYSETVKIGGEVDTSGITALVEFSDGGRKSLTAADLKLGNISTATLGEQDLTVSYENAETGEKVETTVKITVIGVETLTVVDGTVDKEIFKGAALDLSNIKVSVKYTDGSTDSLDFADLSLGSIDVNVAGEQKLAVTYLDKTIEYAVKVCVITAIRFEGVSKTVQAGEPIDISKLVVYGIYDDSHETEIVLSEGITTNVDDIDINSEEAKTLVVSYNGEHGEFSASLIISSTPPELLRIEIRSWNKTIGLGGVYNTNSINVYAIYGNQTEEKITNFTVTAIETGAAGEVEFTVTYTEDGGEKSATEKVTVLPISRLEISGVASVVNKGEALDLSKIKVTAIFSDNSSRVVDVSDISVSTPDTSAAGDKTFTVEYLGFKQPVSYYVRSITSVKILPGSVSTTLRVGYEVDVSGLVLDITYSNGDREQKKASELTGVTCTGTAKGSTKLTVTYKYSDSEKFSDSINLAQITVVRISALNSTIPALVMQGTTIDFSSMSLTLYYDNGEAYLVPLPLPKPGETTATNGYLTVDYKGVNTSKAGAQAISFVYIDGISVNHDYDALYAAGILNLDQYNQIKYRFDTSVNFVVRGIKEIEIVAGSVNDTVFKDKQVDTSEIVVKVTYDDGDDANDDTNKVNYYIYVDKNHPDLKVFDSKNDIDTSKAGENVTLWVEFLGARTSMNITVEELPESTGVVVGVLLPDSVVARDSYKKNFKDMTSPYFVGDDNPYYFYLDVVELDVNDDVVETDGSKRSFEVVVYQIENGVETRLDAVNGMVSFDSSNNSYQFTEDAIGKTFRLEVRLAGTPETTSLKKSHTVTVVDGYNIHNAWELNVMTNVSRDITEKCFGTSNSIDQVKVVDDFLADRGITRPEKLASIVLHGNMNVQYDEDPMKSDIPPEYCYIDENGVNQGFYENHGIFNRQLNPDEKTFTIYGNYYSIYSYNLPNIVPNNVANNDDEAGSSDFIRIENSKLSHNYIREEKTKEAFAEFQITIRDLATRDNDPHSNEQSASERHMRGLTCFEIAELVANVYNVNVDSYMTSMTVDMVGTTVNLEKVNFYNSWQSHLYLWAENKHQTSKGGTKELTWDYIPNLVINIEDSFLAKCGGPVIIAQVNEVNEPCSRTCGMEVNVDKASELWSYVTGQEAWFVAVGQTQIAAQVRALSATIGNGKSFTSTGHIQGVETINMVMVAMGNTGTSLKGTTPNVKYTKDGVVGMQSHHPENTTTFQTTVRDTTINNITQNPSYSALKTAPLFETNTGGLGYVNAKMECTPLDQKFYTGDTITMYYTSLGANIIMEYYDIKK